MRKFTVVSLGTLLAVLLMCPVILYIDLENTPDAEKEEQETKSTSQED